MTPWIVFDTNVYISAFVSGGKPRQVLELAIAGQVQLLVSKPLKLELERVLRDKFDFSPPELAVSTGTLWRQAEWIPPRRRLHLCPDEPDNRVLECAIEGKADFIVTGDKHLLHLPPIQGLAILPPGVFLAGFHATGERP